MICGKNSGRQIHIFLSAVTVADVVNKRVLGTSRAVDFGSRRRKNTSRRKSGECASTSTTTPPLPCAPKRGPRCYARSTQPATRCRFMPKAGGARARIETARGQVATSGRRGAGRCDLHQRRFGSQRPRIARRDTSGGRGGRTHHAADRLRDRARLNSRATPRRARRLTPGLRVATCPVTSQGIVDIAEFKRILGEGKGRALVSVYGREQRDGRHPTARRSRSPSRRRTARWFTAMPCRRPASCRSISPISVSTT